MQNIYIYLDRYSELNSSNPTTSLTNGNSYISWKIWMNEKKWKAFYSIIQIQNPKWIIFFPPSLGRWCVSYKCKIHFSFFFLCILELWWIRDVCISVDFLFHSNAKRKSCFLFPIFDLISKKNQFVVPHKQQTNNKKQ